MRTFHLLLCSVKTILGHILLAQKQNCLLLDTRIHVSTGNFANSGSDLKRAQLESGFILSMCDHRRKIMCRRIKRTSKDTNNQHPNPSSARNITQQHGFSGIATPASSTLSLLHGNTGKVAKCHLKNLKSSLLELEGRTANAWRRQSGYGCTYYRCICFQIKNTKTREEEGEGCF